MTTRTGLPTPQEVSIALAELFEEAAKLGVRPSVLALARRLDIANTTLRRNFPDAVATVSTRMRENPESRTPGGTPPTRIERLERENAKLRGNNRELAEQIDLASAQIQRLALEAHDLRQELQRHTAVSPIRPLHR
ncbi:hypothetical protein MPY17_33220 [Rhodococcus opacus]|uniref:hypothetical protein n=1 Tax=Rhodococcus opacus TaxID=37919 RepID=UPI001FF357CB|nr:hypothetical protein [Rhodococcus opacus]UOT03725.1 hypothetical protein MPY17_33220 [Rhodococcus opacus]